MQSSSLAHASARKCRTMQGVCDDAMWWSCVDVQELPDAVGDDDVAVDGAFDRRAAAAH